MNMKRRLALCRGEDGADFSQEFDLPFQLAILGLQGLICGPLNRAGVLRTDIWMFLFPHPDPDPQSPRNNPNLWCYLRDRPAR